MYQNVDLHKNMKLTPFNNDSNQREIEPVHNHRYGVQNLQVPDDED